MTKKKVNFVCLDVGGDKIGVLAANVILEDKFQIEHCAIYASQGFKVGAVTNFEKAETSINNVIDNTEKKIESSIDKVSVVISGGDIESSYISYDHQLMGNTVKRSDISTLALKAVSQYNVPNRTIIHCFPIDFDVDEHKSLQNPVGIVGNKLRCNFHVISTSNNIIQGLTNCFDKCNVKIDEFLLSSIVEGISYCKSGNSDDEGILVIDFGYLSTTFTVFSDNTPLFSGFIPIGGYHITNDLSQVLSVNFNTAEKLKILFCDISKNDSIVVDASKLQENKEETDLGNTSNQNVETRLINDVVRARLKEMINLIKDKIKLKNENLLKISSKKIILTGCASQIKGLETLCANIFDASLVKESNEFWSDYNSIDETKNVKPYTSLFSSLEYRAQNYSNYYSTTTQLSFFKRIINFFKNL